MQPKQRWFLSNDRWVRFSDCWCTQLPICDPGYLLSAFTREAGAGWRSQSRKILGPSSCTRLHKWANVNRPSTLFILILTRSLMWIWSFRCQIPKIFRKGLLWPVLFPAPGLTYQMSFDSNVPGYTTHHGLISKAQNKLKICSQHNSYSLQRMCLYYVILANSNIPAFEEDLVGK